MPAAFSNLLVHLVFATKHREPLIAPAWSEELYCYIGGIVRNTGCTSLIAGGMPDHIHLLVKLRTDISVAELVRLVKTNSSKWVHEGKHADRDFAWQTGYGAFSVSESQAGVVRKYIETQAEHHRQRTFQEEFAELLRRHGFELDPNYAWE